MTAAPRSESSFRVVRQGGEERFVFSGEFTAHSLGAVESALRPAVRSARLPVSMDLDAVTRLDTAGALLVNLAAGTIRERGLACSVRAAHEEHAALLKNALPPAPESEAAAPPPLVLRLLGALGKAVCEKMETFTRLLAFFGQFVTLALWLALRPARMRWTSLVFHIEQTGVRAVPIVALLTFLIGMVVAYMGAEQLSRFGAQIFAVKLLEVTVLREMAVLITAIVVAGRSSSSFTAQIGAMVANEEVAAIRSMGLDPSILLVAPRVLALMLSLPILVFVADIAALAGGAMAIWYSMGLDPEAFVTQFNSVAELKNFLVGLIKTPFFAMAIGLVGCFQGFRATSSAESVGLLTTVSVVQAIFAVIVLDALFAIFFTTIGI